MATSENNRKAKFDRITRSGRKALALEQQHWLRTTDIIAHFLALEEEQS